LAFHSGREADHSPPSSAEVKKIGGAVPPLPQYAFMAWCSVRGSTGITLPLPFTLAYLDNVNHPVLKHGGRACYETLHRASELAGSY
jgi:hypothetical protein